MQYENMFTRLNQIGGHLIPPKSPRSRDQERLSRRSAHDLTVETSVEIAHVETYWLAVSFEYSLRTQG
jgi:hypothetical protein